jgi:glycosyltransferase involved in cell wall biosynthesis
MHDSITPFGTLSVALFFTQGVSLRAWDDAGMFEREVALYRHLQSRGVKIVFVTYGDRTDLDYQNRIPGIKICCNNWKLPDWLYAKLIPWLHSNALKTVDLIKTNQTKGADIALETAQYCNKPMLARCGYMWSEFSALEQGVDSQIVAQSLAIECKVFRAADGIVVTTSAMRAAVQARFSELNDKVSVIPNYVDTDHFNPALTAKDYGQPRLCFVGRLDQQKNIKALIEAVSDLDIDLDIIGQGVLYAQLSSIAAMNPRIRFLGAIPHKQLPDILRSCSAFILPSLYEGHPKVLLEAMACGLPVIGTDVSGIKEVITHGQNGWLCKPDADSIREAIQNVLADTALQKMLGSNAYRYVEGNYSLKNIVETELNLYRKIVDKG